MAHSERFEELAALAALGIPLGAEDAEFSHHLAECEECRIFLEEARSATSMLAFAVPSVAPRPLLKKKILAAVLGTSPGGPVRVAQAPMTAPRGSALAPWLFAAAAALMLVGVLWDDARLRREREDLRSQTADLSTRLDAVKRDVARRDLQVRVFESEDVRVLFLSGKMPQPDARGKVFWSAKSRRGVLLAGNLQPLPAGKQYELWVFAAGKPVPAGVFDADASGRALFESPDVSAIDAAQNFAVTVEPRGGVPAPTGPIVLVGAP
jgi:hypothetical protein